MQIKLNDNLLNEMRPEKITRPAGKEIVLSKEDFFTLYTSLKKDISESLKNEIKEEIVSSLKPFLDNYIRRTQKEINLLTQEVNNLVQEIETVENKVDYIFREDKIKAQKAAEARLAARQIAEESEELTEKAERDLERLFNSFKGGRNSW